MSLPQTVVEALISRGRQTPHDLAYGADGESIGYGALLEDARRLASRLGHYGVDRGERCALLLPTGLDFIRTVYAIQLSGGVPVAVNPDLPVDAIVRRLRLVRPKLGVCTAGTAEPFEARVALPCPIVSVTELIRSPRLSALPAQPEPQDTAFLQLTSGTTGEPRAAVISHRSLAASHSATVERLDLRSNDVLATWVPLHHDLGLVRYVFGAMFSGRPSHLSRPSIGNLRPWLELVARVRATITGGPDSAYRLAARTVDPERPPLDLRSLRFAGNGGETVRLATIEAFERRFGLPGVVRPAYGLAEATLTVASTGPGEKLRIDEHGTVSCGRPLTGFDLEVVDAEDRPIPRGSVGQILVRGIPVFDGYFEDGESTSSALRDGWLHTGDVGTVDAQGYLYLKGRSRALIKRAGATIAPREIEDAVNRVPGVGSSAAIGAALSTVSDTETIVVVVELDRSAAAAPERRGKIVDAVHAEVANAIGLAPGRVILVAEGTIPRTAAGKVQYDELRRMMTHILGAAR